MKELTEFFRVIVIYLNCIVHMYLEISKGHLCHNWSLDVFTVLGTSGKPHSVRIFPSESCTCPATRRCYHIVAAQKSVGLEDLDTDSKKRINLIQLQRNTHNGANKKSRRKAPHPCDYDIVPAPDSQRSKQVISFILLYLVYLKFHW